MPHPQFTEVIKLCNGVFNNVEYHAERAAQTAMHFYGTTCDLRPALESIPDEARKGLYKCRVAYAETVKEISFTPYTLRKIDTLAIVTDNTIEYAWKYADRSRLNSLVQASGCDEIIIEKEGVLTDSSFSNLVFESKEGLFTPKESLLAGTKRRQLLQKGAIMEATIPVKEITRYHKIHFINAMVELGEMSYQIESHFPFLIKRL